ncbi:MAG TPA: YopX family protein [Ktedonobacteraceae bacterium]
MTPKFRAWHKKYKKMYTVKGWTQGEYGPDDLCVYAVDEQRVTERFADGLVQLLQYTGLKDKAGGEICEGDILYVNAGNPEQECVYGPVVWDDISAGFYVRLPHDHELNQTFVDDDMLIVGNIYENPDMVGKE